MKFLNHLFRKNNASLTRSTIPVLLETIYKESFSFHVEKYEEWRAGQCTNKGSLSFDLHLIAGSEKIFVTIPNAEKFRMHRNVSFNFMGSSILSDRIQYVNFSDFDPMQPIVLHVFIKNSTISHLRFAMTSPDRIIELYGYQVV